MMQKMVMVLMTMKKKKGYHDWMMVEDVSHRWRIESAMWEDQECQVINTPRVRDS